MLSRTDASIALLQNMIHRVCKFCRFRSEDVIDQCNTTYHEIVRWLHEFAGQSSFCSCLDISNAGIFPRFTHESYTLTTSGTLDLLSSDPKESANKLAKVTISLTGVAFVATVRVCCRIPCQFSSLGGGQSHHPHTQCLTISRYFASCLISSAHAMLTV